jgi:hypothetical protein
LEGRRLPPPILFHDDQRRPRQDFAGLATIVEFQVCVDKNHGHVGAEEPNPLQGEMISAALVDGVKNLPMDRLNGGAPIQLPAEDVNEGGIVSKIRREGCAVARVPSLFELGYDLAEACSSVVTVTLLGLPAFGFPDRCRSLPTACRRYRAQAQGSQCRQHRRSVGPYSQRIFVVANAHRREFRL